MYVILSMDFFQLQDFEDGINTTTDQDFEQNNSVQHPALLGEPLQPIGYTLNWIERFSQLSLANTGACRLPDRIARKLSVLSARVAKRFCDTAIGRSFRFISDIIRPASTDTANELIAAISKGRVDTVIAIYHPETVSLRKLTVVLFLTVRLRKSP